MLELFGLVFGGVSRLAQHYLDLRDKQAERDHEARLFEHQVKLQEMKGQADLALRRMDATLATDQGEMALLQGALEAQSREATAAGGWVLKLSAAIRPVLTVWHAVVVYTLIKVAVVAVALAQGQSWPQAVLAIYTEFDRALCGSIVSFWFADRSLRKAGHA